MPKLDRFAIFSSALLLFFLIVWGMTGNCPLRPDGDEWLYVVPALRMAQSFSFNPLWLSHPASTTIYPLLLYVHFLNAVYFHGDLLSHNANLDNVLFEHIFLLCYLPRFMDVLALVACIPLIYGIGKRLFGRSAAVCACFLFAVTPQLVYLGQIIRSDCPALFFSLLAIYLILRLLDVPSLKRHILAGIAMGLALSSRFNTLALFPVLVGADAKLIFETKIASEARRIIAFCAIGLLTALAIFAITTPYFFLDFNTFQSNMAAERMELGLGRDGLSPPENFRYYLTEAIPGLLDQYVPALALISLIISIVRKRFEPLLLASYALAVMVGTSLHTSHDIRWMVPTIPIAVLFAANTLAQVGSLLAHTLQQLTSRKLAAVLSMATVAILVAILKINALSQICMENTSKLHFGTEALFYDWILKNVPPGTAICCVGAWAGPHRERYNVKDVVWGPNYFDKINHGLYLSPQEISRQGFKYFISNNSEYPAYFKEPQRYAHHCRFFKELWANSKIVKQFIPEKLSVGGFFETEQNGPTYTLYKYGLEN